MADNITISKHPQLSPGQDYQFLRRTGMAYLEQLGSSLWTDYNIHDPGITLLELLSYAITDLSYRASFDIKDILADKPGVKPAPDLQAFFTARDILTTNPWTPEDYRKLLIDINGIKNAWLQCRKCPCDDIFLYANCAKSVLQYQATEHTIIIKGMYDVLVEFEDEEGMGDLNSGKIKYNFSYPLAFSLDQQYATATIEMRLPTWQSLQNNPQYADFLTHKDQIDQVVVAIISGNKTDKADIQQNDLGKALRGPLFVTVTLFFKNVATGFTFPEPIPANIWFKGDASRKALLVEQLRDAISDSGSGGIFSKYADKIQRADAVMTEVKKQLHDHRNLCEDYCSIKAIPVQDVAICADMDVAPDADIEAILAQAYYLIDQYFSPDIRFYSLKELLDKGMNVEDVFDGPQLTNGFIDNDQLAVTQLKTELHSSDVINLLMDIPGVIAVRNFVFSPFDKEGRRLQPEPWIYKVPANRQPRLYLEASKWMVFKNGLSFLPDNMELSDTMQVLKGRNAQPKYSIEENNLPVPRGNYYQMDDYQPLKYSLPLTYGVGEVGLPPHVSDLRKAQAKQLKGYLMFFEQILVNYLASLSHVKDVFSLNPAVSNTYFSRQLTAAEIAGINDIYTTIDDTPLDDYTLQQLTENKATFLDRRNRFLNHLMARFSEQFTDYALMLYSYAGNKNVADETLVKDKIAFLQDYPEMSRNKAKAVNYKDASHVCNPENITGLQLRIARLLGFKMASTCWEFYEELDNDGKLYERRWRMRNHQGKIMLSSTTRFYSPDMQTANDMAQAEVDVVLQHILNPAMYEIKKVKKWVVNLLDENGDIIATRKQHFAEEKDAIAARDQIIAFGEQLTAGEKIHVVEHLLLRPRNRPDAVIPEGDPLLGICIDPDCSLCGEEDAYSFRMTIVMNGESGLANAGVAYRRFAEQTIRMEIPAHLGLKICWVSTKQMLQFEPLYCAWLSELAKPEPDRKELHNRLVALMEVFNDLKSVYPPATLHDCVDGNDENRVYLNQTII